MSSKQTKYWVFTLNNPTAEEEGEIEQFLDEGSKATYVVLGRERGENGTPHLQGYIELANRARLAGVKKLPGLSRAHWEPRRGTGEEASTYCKKDGDFYEKGTLAGGRGTRNDLAMVRERIESGATELEVADEFFGDWCRYRGSFEAYRSLKKAKVSREVRVTFLWGNPGTGKTRGVFETYPDVWISSDPTLQWFDGYNGEDTVLLDDYRGGAADSLILRILDRYPTQVAVKGSFRSWTPTRIFISSNMPLAEMHTAVSAALARRVHSTFHLEGPLYEPGNEANLERFLGMIKQ